MITLRSLSLALALSGACLMTCAGAQAAPQTRAPANSPGPNAKVAPPVPDGTLGMALLAAQVSGSAAVNFGAGATGAIRIGTGTYEVDFNRDVSGCFYAANGFDSTVATNLEPRFSNVNGVFLEIRDLAGNVVDDTFYLTVYCVR